MSTAAIVAGTAAAGLAGSAISANAAGNAANAQVGAAEQAQNLQAQEAQNALNFQEKQWNTQQTNLQPWLQAGQGALGNIESNLPGWEKSLSTPFQAPTSVTEQNDPGYQFRLQQGEGALENSAAAKGSLLSGNTLEAQQAFGQNYASNEYGNVYNRALEQYGLGRQNVLDQYNMQAGVAGTGQQAANTLGQEGQAAASNVGNISLTSGAQQGQDLQNAGAAMASGYVGQANAWNAGLTGATGNLMNYALMNQLFGQGGGNSAQGTTAPVWGGS